MGSVSGVGNGYGGRGKRGGVLPLAVMCCRRLSVPGFRLKTEKTSPKSQKITQKPFHMPRMTILEVSNLKNPPYALRNSQKLQKTRIGENSANR